MQDEQTAQLVRTLYTAMNSKDAANVPLQQQVQELTLQGVTFSALYHSSDTSKAEIS